MSFQIVREDEELSAPVRAKKILPDAEVEKTQDEEVHDQCGYQSFLHVFISAVMNNIQDAAWCCLQGGPGKADCYRKSEGRSNSVDFEFDWLLTRAGRTYLGMFSDVASHLHLT